MKKEISIKKESTEPQTAKSTKKQLQGIIVSDKMKDTVVVEVERFFKHKKYKKYISRSKKFMAHDVGNTCKIGDKVTIEETAPISRRKRFKVVVSKTGEKI